MAGEPEVHEIRKYPNRRFYDATDRRHLSLEDVHALVADGHEVRITDSKTGEDITAAVLTQIILKLDASKLQLFPVALLHRMIRANEKVVGEFVTNYFQQAMSFLMDAQRELESQTRKTFPGVPPGLSVWADQAMRSFYPAWPGDGGAAGRGQGGEPAEDPSSRKLREELEAVKAQLERLQEEMARRSPARPEAGGEAG